jgi:ribonuclease R
MPYITGVLALNNKGKGYVRPLQSEAGQKAVFSPKKEDSIVIPLQFISDALPGDTVVVDTFPKPNKWGEIEGKVTKVESRGSSKFVAIITEVAPNRIVAKPDNQKLTCAFTLMHDTAFPVQKGQKVLVEIQWSKKPYVTVQKKQTPEGYINTEITREFYGKVTEIFGMQGEHQAEMRSIVAAAGFDIEHSPEVEADAARAVEQYGTMTDEELAKRRDFRDVWTCTIDPVDAKDFDDALSFRVLPNGNAEIGIHIADVSHFVRPGTVLDTEARKRAFSVYLVDRTIPMLPEVLSNGMCSLNPNQDRFAFSAVFEFDERHAIVSKWFGKTVIHSNKRFSYEEAQGVLDAGDMAAFPALFSLQVFAKELQAARKRAGAIDFESDEIKFVLDDKGFPIQVYKKDRIFTNHLVEEFMLLANREVAEYMYFNNVYGTKKLLGVYRVHDLPDPEKITDLQIFVNALGLEFHPGKKIHAKDIQHLLDKAAGHPAEMIIKTATLRSMAKAAYKTVNIGHFGLAFEYYTHFTSPIRRYPDLSVHRIMQHVLTNTPISQAMTDSLEDICTHSSGQEVKAAEAERASVRYKQVEFLSRKVGQEFDVVVSGIADFGVFLQEKESLAEGLVRLKDLGSDFFEVDKKTYKVFGQNTKKVLTLGDTVHVRLRGVDLESKSVDFEVLSL